MAIRLLKNEGVALTGKRADCRIRRWLLVKPQTFMNNSGSGHSGRPEVPQPDDRDLIVVHDEIGLCLGPACGSR